MSAIAPSDRRRSELADALAEVEARVSAACVAAGRLRAEVTLVAVSKTWPVADVLGLHELGVRDFGENRDEEAAEKATVLREAGVEGLCWHFVGQVQSRKAASVARHADVVHSVDRAKLVGALARGAVDAGRSVQVLLQVSLDTTAGRGGARPEDLGALAEQVQGAEGLVLAGVMAVAPLGADAAQAYARLQDLAARLRADHPHARWVSAGMSGDLEQAVAHGATHLRVGTALFGGRAPLLR